MGGHIYDLERSRWGLGDAFIALAIYLTMATAFSGLFFVLDDGDGIPRNLWLPLLVVAPAACQFAYVAWIGRIKGQGIVADFRAQIRPSDAAVGAGLCISALILAGITAQITTEILGEPPTAAVADLIEDSADETDGPTADQSSGTDSAADGTVPRTSAGSTSKLTIGIYVLAFLGATFIPIAEEVLFRGLFWSALEKRGVHQIVSLMITSALFAAFHLEPWRTAVLFVLGLVIGLGRIATGRIGASIFAHMYVNAMGMTFLLIELS